MQKVGLKRKELERYCLSLHRKQKQIWQTNN